jgi:hypothetical protein
MKKAFLQKGIYRQMVANIFSEEYIFFSDFLNHIFLMGKVLKKRRANLSDVAKERVNILQIDLNCRKNSKIKLQNTFFFIFSHFLRKWHFWF